MGRKVSQKGLKLLKKGPFEMVGKNKKHGS